MTLLIREVDVPARVVVIEPDRRLNGLELYDARGLPVPNYASAVLGVAGPPGERISWVVRPYRRAGLQ